MSNQPCSSHTHFAAACNAFAIRHNLSQLARDIGMSGHVLHNKFNPACERHKLTATDLINLYHATGDDTLFDGLLFDCGLTAVRLPAADAAVQPEARAQQALAASAQIIGVTAQATQLLGSGRVNQYHRNALVGGLMVGIEHLVSLVAEVEHKFNTIPTLACATDLALAVVGV